MDILPYDIEKKILKHAETRHKAFYYFYFNSDIPQFAANVERWKGQKKILMDVLADLKEGNLKWQENPFFDYNRDLSGTHFKRFQTNKRLYALEHTALNNCLFEMSRFETIQEDNEEEDRNDALFWGCQIKSAYFKSCKFINVSFCEGVFNNIVFSDCEFINVDFNKNNDGYYDSLFFQNCRFKKVDFSKIDLTNSCFWGQCFFDEVAYSKKTVSNKRIIGAKIIADCRLYDLESYPKRLENNYQGGPFNKIEIESAKEDMVKVQVFKYSSLINIYDGLASFYNYLSNNENKEGEHLLYLQFNYLYKWLKDQKNVLLKGKIRNISAYIARYLLGYGVKAERPLIAYSVMIVLFAFLHLLNGVSYQGQQYNRDLTFVPSEFISTVNDYALCLYYSTITSTTIGYGDVLADSPATMVLASIQGILGVILMTMFTVIFGRRFFQ